MAGEKAAQNSLSATLMGETAIQDQNNNNNHTLIAHKGQSQIYSGSDELMLKVGKSQPNGAAVHRSTNEASLPNVKVSDIIGKHFHQANDSKITIVNLYSKTPIH